VNKKKILSSLFSRLGLLPLLRMYDARSYSLKILAYHRVMDIDTDSYLFDQNLVDVSVEGFDRQMEFLSRYYQILPLSVAIDAFGKEQQKNIVSLTFDDGFDDLYFNVFPVLKKYNIKPTIFITTGLIGTSDTLWSERVVHAIKSSVGQTLQVSSVNGGDRVVIIKERVDAIIGELLRNLKQIPDSARRCSVAEVLGQTFP